MKIRFGKILLVGLFALLGSAAAHGQCTKAIGGFFGETQNCIAGSRVQAGQIVTLNSSSQVVPIPKTSTSGAYGIATTGGATGFSIQVLISGNAPVSVDNVCVVNNVVIISATNDGNGHCAATNGGAQQVGLATTASASSSGSIFIQVSALSSGFGSSGGGGAVTSVFGRTAAVVAVANDYSFSLLSGSAACSQLPALTGDATSSAGSCATTVAALRSLALPTLAASTGFLFDNAGTLSLSASASNFTTGTLPHAQLPTLLSGDIPNNAANTTGTAANLTGCAPSTAGSFCYWNGTAWTLLAGNASGTNWLQETSAGVPSWTTPSGTAFTPQTNGVTNTSTTALNFTNSTTNSMGITLTWTNPGTSVEHAELTGTTNVASGGTGLSNPTIHLDLQAEGSSNFGLVGAGAKTGQVKTAVNGADPAYVSPGVADGNGGVAVTTTPYPIACDSGTALVDRATTLRFQSGAAVVTVPLSTAAGCTGNFVVTLIDDGAGTLTVNRTSADTFSVFNGGTATDGATSFTLSNGQYASLNQGASGIWNVRITTQNATTVNAGTVPTSATVVATNSSAQPIAAPLPSTDIWVGNGSNLPVAVAVSGDSTMTNAGVMTNTKVNGGTFPASAGVLGTNVSNQPVTATAHGVSTPLFCNTGSASGTTYTCTTSPTFTPATGDVINVKIDTTNTGSSTLNINGTGAVTIKKPFNGTLVNLSAADLTIGQVLEMFFDGTNWQANCLTLPSPASPIFSTTDTLSDTVTTEQLYATNMKIPANTLITNRAYRFMVEVEWTALAAIPNAIFQIYLCPTQGSLTGCKNVFKSTNTSIGTTGQTQNSAMEFGMVGESAAGATATVMMMPAGGVGATSPFGKNTVAASQGNVPTNADLFVQFSITYVSAAGAGTNTLSVRALVAEPGPLL